MTVLYQHRLLASGTLDFGSEFGGEKEKLEVRGGGGGGADTRVS